MKRRNSHQGFSLIELMIVVSICCIIMYCTFHYCFLFDTFIVKAELHHLEMICQQTRARAVHTHTTQTIFLDPVIHSYHNAECAHTLSAGVHFGFCADALGPPSAPTIPLTSSITFKDNQIQCFSDGTVSAGIVYLTNQQKNNCYALSNGVGAVSYFRLYRYDKKTWKPLTE